MRDHGEHIVGRPLGLKVDELVGSPQQASASQGRRISWERSGSAYRITLMGLTLRPSVGFGGMFNAPKRADGSACQCVIDVTATAELHGDELVIEAEKERAHRVK